MREDTNTAFLARAIAVSLSLIAFSVPAHGSLEPTAAWIAEGDQADIQLGTSVQTAGDVNGDGYSDVIVGAPRFTNGELREGRALVYLGSSSGLAATPAWTAESDQLESSFGHAVATAGDVNCDGFSDVVVGAYRYDNGTGDEGAVFVYHGSATGLSTSADWTADSNLANSWFGRAVGTAGDVNGDGCSDLIVGAGKYSNGQVDEGAIFIYHGSPTGLSAVPDLSIESNTAGILYGLSVATAGDVNGDGYADVVIGAPLFQNGQSNEGTAYAYHGSPGGIVTPAVWSIELNLVNGFAGVSVFTAGDVNGDGYADVIVGVDGYSNGQAGEGAAVVYHGSASGLETTHAWIHESNNAGAEFGEAVGAAGDINGDGYADVIVGARLYSNPEPGEGGAFVYLGSEDGLETTEVWSDEYNQDQARFGFAVGPAGDVDGDGYSDVIVGAFLADNGEVDEGMAFVYHGAPGDLADDFEWEDEDVNVAETGIAASTGDLDGDGESDFAYQIGGDTELHLGAGLGGWIFNGSLVMAFGDFNGDGYDDLVDSYPPGGWALVIAGGPSFDPNDAAAWIWSYDSIEGDQFGAALAGCDVDGDGYDDLAASGPYYDEGEGEGAEGRVLIFRGSAVGPSLSATWSLQSDSLNALLGTTMVCAGDVDGNGAEDLLVGAPDLSNGEVSEGAVYLYLGSALGPDRLRVWKLEGDAPSRGLGHTLSAAGDVNGDGYDDILVGTLDEEALLFLGSAAGPALVPDWQVGAAQPGDGTGSALAGIGDVNQDGYADFVVGEAGRTVTLSEQGMVSLFLGSPSGPSTLPDRTILGTMAFEQLGFAVGPAGDVEGDGASDFLVGTNVGKVRAYYGNNGGVGRIAQPRQPDGGSPITFGGRSMEKDRFGMRALGRSPFGRADVRMEIEAKPTGVGFDGIGTDVAASWVDSGTSGVVVDELIDGLDPITRYEWRFRMLYEPVTSPFLPGGPWIRPHRGGAESATVSTTGEVDLTVTQTVLTTPALLLNPVDYQIEVSSSGPETATAMVRADLPANSSFVDALPSAGQCWQDQALLVCDLGTLTDGQAEAVTVTVIPDVIAPAYPNVATVGSLGSDPDPGDNSDTAAPAVYDLGDRVWQDLDGDGLQEPGEPGFVSALVYLLDEVGTIRDFAFTDANGDYFIDLTAPGNYSLRFIPPPGHVLSPQDQGGDDQTDSDADPVTGQTPLIGPFVATDPLRWDVGVTSTAPCVAPDEPVYLYSVTLSTDGNDYPILHFMDPNQPTQVTGYNIYRSSDAGLPIGSWPLIADDVIDMDEGTPNKQWVDTTGDVSPTGLWFYQVTAFSHLCPAEGPF